MNDAEDLIALRRMAELEARTSAVLPAKAPPEPSYTQNVKQDFSDAKNKIGQLWANQQTGEGQQLNPVSTGLQMLGAAVGGAYAPIGEGVSRGYNSLPNEVTQPVNQAIGAASQAVGDTYKSGVSSFAETSAGKAIGDYLMNSPHIQNGMQEISDDAKALASILTMDKVKPALGDASMAVGDKLYYSGKGDQVAANQAHLKELVRPPETPTIKAENAKNTIQVNGKNIYQHTPDELQMAKTIGDIPSVGDSLTPQGNLSAIIAERTKEAQSLQGTLQKNGAQVDFQNFQNGIDTAVRNIKQNPLIVGEGKEVSESIINGMNKAILNNMSPNGEISAAGMLRARKDFDAALPNRVFNGSNADTALVATAKEMRRAMNNAIAHADPSADVATSLKKQAVLYDAADNIAPKAAGEASTPFKRGVQSMKPDNLVHAIGGAGAGAAALAAAHYLPISPTMIGAALAPVVAYKGITAPTTRVLLGKALGGGQ